MSLVRWPSELQRTNINAVISWSEAAFATTPTVEENDLRARFENQPVDLYASLLLSAAVAILIYLGVTGPLRIALGLPFVLFVPGYVFIFALFPEKRGRHRGIDTVERVALSLGMSIAIVPLLGLALNYTPWGIRLEPILISLLIFVGGSSLFGGLRWRSLERERRHIVEFEIDWSSFGESRVDKVLSIILIASILAAIGTLIWAITKPRIGERFTEFYMLGQSGLADQYPTNLTLNQSAAIVLGIQNHEYQNLTYHIETWLINQTWDDKTNTTAYYWGILLDRFDVALPSRPVKVDEPWTPQWEKNYTFTVPRRGKNKLALLLFKERPPALPSGAGQEFGPAIVRARMESAYRKIHLWVNVT